MSQRLTDLSLSILISFVGCLLSYPFWRDYEYWAESPAAWWIYFILGFLLCIYILYVFIGSLRMLFLHALEEKALQQAYEDTYESTHSLGRSASSQTSEDSPVTETMPNETLAKEERP